MQPDIVNEPLTHPRVPYGRDRLQAPPSEPVADVDKPRFLRSLEQERYASSASNRSPMRW